MADTSGETNIPVSEFTTGTLKILEDTTIELIKQLLLQRIDYERQVADERDRRYDERWQAQEKATTRYQLVANEFRGSLDDLSSKMATKVEVATAVGTLVDKIDTQSNLIGELRSRLDVGNPDVRTLQDQQANQTGRVMGSDKTLYYLVTALSILGLIGWLN